jgi:3-isopropylmalate/(R)-2-methylmalate dehydratase large subunit
VPRTIRYEFDGRLAYGVTAKDMMLMLIGRFGLSGADYQAVEFAGEAVHGLSMQERMTLANLSAELGAQTALIEPDPVLFDFLRAANVSLDEALPCAWRSDDDARFGAVHRFDAALLEPMVAAPHSPANSRAVSKFTDVPIDIAYIGACTGAKLADLRMAAEILKGHRVAPQVELRVAPASLQDLEQARGEGVLDSLLDAGARLLPSACGMCAGYGASRLAAGQTAISSTARNFKGRMGDADSQVYLASPYTVAASALTGRITDPRPMLASR